MKKSLILAALVVFLITAPVFAKTPLPENTNPQLAALLKNKKRTIVVQKKLTVWLKQAETAKLACEKYADFNGGCVTGICDKTHKTNVINAQKVLKPKCNLAKNVKKQLASLSAEFKSSAYKKNLSKLSSNLGYLNQYITTVNARLSDVTNNVDDYEIALESLLSDANITLNTKTNSLKDFPDKLQTILDKITPVKQSCQEVAQNNECSFIYCTDKTKEQAQLTAKTLALPACQANINARKNIVNLIIKTDNKDDRNLLIKLNLALFKLDNFILVEKHPYDIEKAMFDDLDILIGQLQAANNQ